MYFPHKAYCVLRSSVKILQSSVVLKAKPLDMNLPYRLLTFAETEGENKKRISKEICKPVALSGPLESTGMKQIQLCFYKSCFKKI